MEHGIEVLIKIIASDSPEKIGLLDHVIKPCGFRQKLQVLRGLVADLSDHYVRSAELDRAYTEFAGAIKSLSSAAGKLNEFLTISFTGGRSWWFLTGRSSLSSPPLPRRRST
jgi:hypothetical protein